MLARGSWTDINVVGLCGSVKTTECEIELLFFINAVEEVDFGQGWQRFARISLRLKAGD